MAIPGGHYAELNKPDTKGSDLSEKPEIVRFIKAESRMVVTRAGGGEIGSYFPTGIIFQLCKFISSSIYSRVCVLGC